MSVSSIGGDTSQAWQILRESRAKQSASSSATGALAAPPPKNTLPGAPPDALASGAADARGSPSTAPDVSSASAKVIADLKALFISLQSASASNTTGSTGASSVGAASNSTAATSTGTAGTTRAAADTTPATGTSSNVQSDLKTLFSDLSEVSDHGGHHHSHGKPPAAQSTTPSPDATAGTTTTGPAAASAAAKPSGGLLDQLAGALKAYAASSIDHSARGATALLSA